MAALVPAAPAPTEFDANLASWVANRYKESIFFVQLLPRQDMIQRIEELADDIDSVEDDEERSLRVNFGSCCTAFVVASQEDRLRLLTCAHGLEHLFKGSRPLSVQRANHLIRTTVLCDHFEHDYRQGGLNGERRYARARIAAIDCVRDLMVVDVQRAELKGIDGQVCRSSHRPIRLSRAGVGDRMTKCLLLSWPSYKHRKKTEGHTSTIRRITEISEPNRVEYDMDLLEVNMGTEAGSSGGPLLNGAGEAIGLLHGTFGNADSSYFVAVHHLLDFVTPYL